MRIAIDAGHGMNTLGKRCLKSIDPNQTREWWLNQRIATYVTEHLRRCGQEVIRLDDITGKRDVPLSTRVNTANGQGTHYCVSIHHNAGINGGSGGGAVVFVYNGKHSSASDALQRNIYNCMIAETGKFGNRSNPLASKNLYMVRKTNMPSVLVEVGFMDSTKDTSMILTEEFAVKAARGIAKGICKTAGITWKDGEETAPVEPAAPAGSMDTVAEIQAWAGVTADGIYGPNTHKAIVKKTQIAIGVTADGIFGSKSKSAWPTTRKGHKGETVKCVQAMLICRGYPCGSAGADGDFGSGTDSAVKEFQRAEGVTVDGMVGRNTAYKLFG